MEVMFGAADADVPPPKVVPIVPSKHYRTTAMTDLEIGLSVMVFLAAFNGRDGIALWCPCISGGTQAATQAVVAASMRHAKPALPSICGHYRRG
jgi:hypothetical protein